MATDDRRTLLCNQTDLTGIDFVQVEDPHEQTVLRVYFIVDPQNMTPALDDSDFAPEWTQIFATYPGEPIEEVEVVGTQLLTDGTLARQYLEVTVAQPGGFSIYTLGLLSNDAPPTPNPRIDFAFNDVEFSFKQGCPSDLDCKTHVDLCKPETLEDFPVDYLARDFVSLRNALLDFAAQRYPQWTLPVVADAGVMMAEIMAALGDEFAYIQDRYAREAYLGTATQRRSLRHHARLVDYEIQEPINAETLLAVTVSANTPLLAGTPFYCLPESAPPIPFSVGTGLADERAETEYELRLAWQEVHAYVADPSHSMLPCGSTSILLQGHVDDAQDWVGQPLLIEEIATEAGQSQNRILVHPTAVQNDLVDALCTENYTRVTWGADEALGCELDLARVQVTANLVPATAGETRREYFVVNEPAQEGLAPNPEAPPAEITVSFTRAVERQGPLNELTCERTPIVMYSLRASEAENLGWVDTSQPGTSSGSRDSDPEIALDQLDSSGSVQETWEFRESLLSSGPLDEHFTLDDGMWRQIISFPGYENFGDILRFEDYATQLGMTVRFGDGEFGLIPAAGDRFVATYRTGPGTEANLPPDTVNELSLPGGTTPMNVTAVRNPFAITSGKAEEPAEVIKQLAPEAFRAETFRAVRPEDYDEIAERLDWVQRAGTAFRWTGSYLAAFVTPDPLDAFTLSADRRTELEDLVDCVRQVGRCAFVSDPKFVDIDLVVEVCIEAGAFGGQVKARIVEALAGRGGARPLPGFFDPDNFTFGTPLRRSKLEAVVQGVPGVKAVERILIRARGKTEFVEWKTLTYEVGDDEIIRMQNDPRFPGRGSVRAVVLEVVS